jgi:hypothetical protein
MNVSIAFLAVLLKPIEFGGEFFTSKNGSRMLEKTKKEGAGANIDE